MIFIVLGLLMITGILRGAPDAGLLNWQTGSGPFAGNIFSMIGVAMIVGVSFQGTELIGIAAGEAQEPEKAIPRAMRGVFWRILLFYVFAILVISLTVPYTDHLLQSDVDNVSMSRLHWYSRMQDYYPPRRS